MGLSMSPRIAFYYVYKPVNSMISVVFERLMLDSIPSLTLNEIGFFVHLCLFPDCTFVSGYCYFDGQRPLHQDQER